MNGRSGRAGRAGKVRPARLTDLAALGELSRLAQAGESGARSLGLPVAGPPIGVFTLFRLPLGAFRPHDLLFVHEDGRPPGGPRCASSATATATSGRSWSSTPSGSATPATSATAWSRPACATSPGAAPPASTSPAPTRDGNVELFMQAGFARYGDEMICFRDAELAAAGAAHARSEAGSLGIRPVGPTDAVALFRLYAPSRRRRCQRLEIEPDRGLGAPGQRRAHAALQPDADPPLRRRRDVPPEAPRAPRTRRPSTASSRSAWPRRTSRTTCASWSGPAPTRRRSCASGWASSPPAPSAATIGRDQGVIAPVRTYESPLEHRLEEEGFATIATVTLLMKETLVRVAEPAMVPAVR